VKRRRGEHHVKFTPWLWRRWLARRNEDDQTVHLRHGIQEFRTLLACDHDMNRKAMR
jgi:hypothetical protein